jgi:hypothetical protein
MGTSRGAGVSTPGPFRVKVLIAELGIAVQHERVK